MKDFTELAAGPLRVPIGGKLYTIPPVGIRVGALLRRTLDPEDVQAIEALQVGGDEAAYQRILGPAYDEMVADDVPQAALDRAYLTAMTDFHKGRVIAELVWEVGHDPKGLREWVAAGARIARSGVASESKTLSPDSSRDTTTSPDAKPKRRPKAHAVSTGAE